MNLSRALGGPIMGIAVLAMPHAVSAAPMTLADAVSYALGHSPVVAAKVSAVAQADHALAAARATAFPTVSGQLQNVMSKQSPTYSAYAVIGASQQSIFSQNSAQISANYSLQFGGLSFIALTTARATDAQARDDLASTEAQIATSTANAYYAVAAKVAIVNVDEADLHYQNELVKAAQVKEKAGVAAGVDVLRAEVAQAKSASNLVGARADAINTREALAQAIGAPLDQAFASEGAIATPAMPRQDVATLESTALDTRRDVFAARESLNAARSTRRGWLSEYAPSAQLSAAFGNQYAPTSFSGTITDPITHATQFVPRGTPGFWTISATTTFTFPLLDYNQRHSERVQYDAQVRSAELLLDQARTQAEIDVRQNYRAAQTALAQLDYAKRESDLGAESAKIARVQYENGLIALSDVIQAQNQAIGAQADLINARVAYVTSIVKLRVSLGTYDARSAVADLGK